MKKVMHFLMLSCNKATELIEKRTIFKLTFKENVQLKMHKTMCDACTAYEKHSKQIDDLLQNNISNIEINTISNQELKSRIINKLQ